MWNANRWLALVPTTLLCLSTVSTVASTTTLQQDGDDGRLSVEDEHWSDLVRRNLAAEAKLANQQPQAVRKMSDDPGEKFWPHFWDFGQDDIVANISVALQPFALHFDVETTIPAILARSLSRRDGTCPAGTSACTSINQPNSCCPSGDRCINVQDTGNGPVGCCAAGQTCGTTISGCDTAQGYTSCPNSDNKGCCIPGYACFNNICLNVGTQTITASTTTPTTTSTSTSSSISVSVIISINTSGFTTTATVTATVTISPSGSASAPVRPTSSSTEAAIVPASVSTSTSTTTVSTVTTSPASTVVGVCPTGYYMCSARFLGGCCQVDRDCNTTFCPETASTTVISGSPTVVAPTGASNAARCANGWFSCPASLGGNCCPNGFNCAQENCPASVSGVAAQNKQSPSEAAVLRWAWSFLLVAVSVGVGMVVL